MKSWKVIELGHTVTEGWELGTILIAVEDRGVLLKQFGVASFTFIDLKGYSREDWIVEVEGDLSRFVLR